MPISFEGNGHYMVLASRTYDVWQCDRCQLARYPLPVPQNDADRAKLREIMEIETAPCKGARGHRSSVPERSTNDDGQ